MPDALPGFLQHIKARRKVRHQVEQKPLPHRKPRHVPIYQVRRQQKRCRDEDLPELLLWLHLLVLIILVFYDGALRFCILFTDFPLFLPCGALRPCAAIRCARGTFGT